MAKKLYEIFQEAELKREADELKAIIDKPSLEPEEIWSITADNFFKWRIKNDYPRILSHFSTRLNGFNDWRNEVKFSDEELFFFGFSNCISPNPAKDKRKFIVERTWGGKRAKFISYQNVDGKFYNMGSDSVNHKVISSFTGYIDWCNGKKIKIMSDWNDNRLLSRPVSSHPVGFPLAIDISI